MLSKTDINGTALRLLTLACYFLPFIFFFSTCVGDISKNAYNKEEAIANEREKIEVEKKDLLNRAVDIIDKNVNVTDSSAELTSETIKIIESSGDDWYVQPTYTSLSVPGIMFNFKNAFGQIILLLSFVLSLLTFLLWRVLKKRKSMGIYCIGINLVLVLVFVVMCLVLDVTVLYGAYALLFLLLVQLLSAIQDKRNKINPTLEGINPN